MKCPICDLPDKHPKHEILTLKAAGEMIRWCPCGALLDEEFKLIAMYGEASEEETERERQKFKALEFKGENGEPWFERE